MECKTCGGNGVRKGRIFCSRKCFTDDMRKRRNEHTNNWRGEDVSIQRKHAWLDDNFGQPKICEVRSSNGSFMKL